MLHNIMWQSVIIFERLAFIQAENIQRPLFQCQGHMFKIKGHGYLKILQCTTLCGSGGLISIYKILALAKGENRLRQSFQHF